MRDGVRDSKGTMSKYVQEDAEREGLHARIYPAASEPRYVVVSGSPLEEYRCVDR